MLIKEEMADEKKIYKVLKILKKYSIEDIATTIFISNIWLRNVASPVKHLFLTTIFLSIDPDSFAPKNRIKKYLDFKMLMENLMRYIPDFPMVEDYIPKRDWGEIKYSHDRKNYHLFYGCELSYPYEYLELFQMLHCTFDVAYNDIAERSPLNELKSCLQIQDKIIKGIQYQPKEEKIKEVAA
ncbi:MAG: hypothetical protein HQL46_12780 [Gammaproteobacteria bacterium]|nr:hypothetical protein [Gammaproteobacteria bacterium]